jgi:hypothetical protein
VLSAEALVATVRHFGWQRMSVLAVHEGSDRALVGSPMHFNDPVQIPNEL